MNSEQNPKTILREQAASSGIGLHATQADRLLDLGERILARNREVNLTGARDLPALIRDHILDSLTLLPIIWRYAAAPCTRHPLIVDIGSGGGFPALPLAIVLVDFDFLCIESVAKKARVLENLCGAIGLDHVTILNDRAERVAHDSRWRETADGATARGIGSLATACELTLPFLRVGGRFLAQKGAEVHTDLAAAQSAIMQLGGRVVEIISVGPERPQGKRTVAIIEKIASSPQQFPRRVGLPAKRPLRDRG